MAASTITRTTWTDDSGTAASPNGDGTTINNSALQAIYDAIEEVWSGTGAYTTMTFGGLIAAEGAGVSTFDGAGAVATGNQGLRVRNTGSNTDDKGYLAIGNDTGTETGLIECYSSAFTETGAKKQDGLAIRATDGGGLSLAAEDAAGDVRLYANGTTKIATFGGEDLEFTGGNRGASHVPMFVDAWLKDDSTGNAADTNYAELYNPIIPANTLNEDGRIITFWMVYEAQSTSHDVQLYLGPDGTEVSAGEQIAEQLNNTNAHGPAYMWVTIIRTGSNAQRVIVGDIGGPGLGTLTDTTQTDSSALGLVLQARSDNSTLNHVQIHAGWGFVER